MPSNWTSNGRSPSARRAASRPTAQIPASSVASAAAAVSAASSRPRSSGSRAAMAGSRASYPPRLADPGFCRKRRTRERSPLTPRPRPGPPRRWPRPAPPGAGRPRPAPPRGALAPSRVAPPLAPPPSWAAPCAPRNALIPSSRATSRCEISPVASMISTPPWRPASSAAARRSASTEGPIWPLACIPRIPSAIFCCHRRNSPTTTSWCSGEPGPSWEVSTASGQDWPWAR